MDSPKIFAPLLSPSNKNDGLLSLMTQERKNTLRSVGFIKQSQLTFVKTRPRKDCVGHVRAC